MKLTSDILASFAGGQIEVRNASKKYIYRGEIQKAVIENNRVRITLEWMAKGENYPPAATGWVKDPINEYSFRLDLFSASDIGPGNEGDTRICLSSYELGDTIVFFPSNGSRLKPSKVRNLILPAGKK